LLEAVEAYQRQGLQNHFKNAYLVALQSIPFLKSFANGSGELALSNRKFVPRGRNADPNTTSSNGRNEDRMISYPSRNLKPYERFWRTIKKKSVLGVGARNSAEALKKEEDRAESDNQSANSTKDA
jgi:hypothetical protein